jgi:hypothetical protein
MFSSTKSRIKLIVRPTRESEPDLLAGYDAEDLLLKGPGGKVIFGIFPSSPWTHDSIVQALDLAEVVRAVHRDVADAYLGDRWIGSTEI